MKCGGLEMVVVAAVIAASDAIRVYEGTNLGPPNSTMWKKSSQIIKRAESRSDHPRAPVQGNQLLKFSKELKSTPDLYKVKLTQQGYLQFLRYLTDVPPLREYTFCLWFAIHNMSHAQPLFSYSMQDKARLLSFWYEPKDATIRKSIRDDLVFKIPVLLQEGKWYHVCQSWNGVLGEWIVFFDGTKIGSGKLQKYKGTYVPGGGEVVVGQEPTDFHKGLDDGLEGEVFGFNLVDEAVKDEIIVQKHHFVPVPVPDVVPQPSQYVPEPTQYVPEPKPYVPPFKSLPPMKKSYQEIKAYIKSLPPPGGYGTRTASKTVPGGHPSKQHHKGKRPGRPMRGKHRPHYKPVKAILYERDDRQLKFDDAELVKKLGKPAEENVNQIYNENYSIHSYRTPKDKPAASSYETWEVPDDDVTLQRKARMNFDIQTAREANNLYELANKARQQKKQAFHFETNTMRNQPGIRRSLTIDKPEGVIPVHENTDEDQPATRRKRDVTDEDLTTNFRPLPQMPDGFINLFAGDKDEQRILTNATEAKTQEADKRNDVFEPPTVTQIRRNMIVTAKDLQRRPGPTSGSELVKRSYEHCTADRGSPVRDKDRLVVSWAETPVRIYGGAVVTTAYNLCGRF